MRLSTRPLAAASATAYLLAGLLAPALHAHVHPGSHAGCGESHCDTQTAQPSHCGCGHQHAHQQPVEPTEPAPAPADHSGCVVCEFLAQPPLPAEPVQLADGLCPLVFLPAPSLAAPPFAAPPAVVARGPPVG